MMNTKWLGGFSSYSFQREKHNNTSENENGNITEGKDGEKSFAIILVLVWDCIVNFVTFKHIVSGSERERVTKMIIIFNELT